MAEPRFDNRDLRNIMDDVVDGLGRITALERLRDMVVQAQQTTRPRCGLCQHWMKKGDCPREKHDNRNGHSVGPSAQDPVCDKFAIEPWATDLQRERVQKAIAFAEERGLPVPDQLRNFVEPEGQS